MNQEFGSRPVKREVPTHPCKGGNWTNESEVWGKRTRLALSIWGSPASDDMGSKAVGQVRSSKRLW